MKKLTPVLALLAALAASAAFQASAKPLSPELTAWHQRAAHISIVRDDWGIPHITAKTDADAVFGMLYAQAEDDFNRIETNFLNSQGRLAEAEGESAIYRDLRMKLFIDPAEMKAQYAKAPTWLKALMDAWAGGLNFYLATHPEVKPRVITRFEPWMALTFSEGSIGGDIEQVDLGQLEAFYGGGPKKLQASAEFHARPPEPTGSNGFAVSGANTASGKALLWINPHTTFFFRHEAQVTSGEGLNVYGASTWGQFFVYQGFNEKAGWMHTSSNVDNIDEYLETIAKKGAGTFYKYGAGERPVAARKIVVPYKSASGMAKKEFTVYRTHHGPVVREAQGKWVAVRLMNEPLKALQQSYLRTKTRNLAEFKKVMDLHTDSSNNTVFADAEGNIAYFHANFIPKRNSKFNWAEPVDGSNPATEWGPVMSVDESPNMFNPANGWIQNTNNWPYSVSGPVSPKQKDYPAYVDMGTENPRGVHAQMMLDGKKGFTKDTLIAAAFDTYLPELAVQLPLLLKDYDALDAADPLKPKLADAVKLLRAWDCRWGASSVATSVAVFWGEEVWQRVEPEAQKAKMSVYDFLRARATPQQRLAALAAAVDKLAVDFGRWDTPWGEINRFQRLTGDIAQPFNDAGASIPVGFPSERWGSLAAFEARAYPGTKKWYGTSGNSFVAAVEFGDTVSARAVTAGGLNSVPASKHFNDQAARYAAGELREVYFYPKQLEAHTERSYTPGER
jgi:acyl-homoserine-lactone acylase